MIKTLITASLFLLSTNLFAQDFSAPMSAEYEPISTETKQRATSETDENDSLSKQSEAQSIKMQRYMDRMRKADETRSDTMKKYSDTSGAIIQNTK